MVVLVHGITTYSFIWDEIVAGLVTDFDVIAVDLLGCGESDMPLDVSYALKDHAVRLAEFTEALELPRFHLVGHDLGGGISQIFAVKYPQRLLDLVLMNTVGYDFWPVQPITALRTPIVRQLLMATLDKGLFRQVVKRGIYHTDRLTDELMERFLAPLKSAAGRKAFLHFARCLDNLNLTELADDLVQMTMPVLVIRGDDDLYLSENIALRLVQDIPHSRLLKVPRASHYIQVDQPEIITESLREFWGEDHG